MRRKGTRRLRAARLKKATERCDRLSVTFTLSSRSTSRSGDGKKSSTILTRPISPLLYLTVGFFTGTSFSAAAILSSVNHSRYNNTLLRPIDFIYHDIRQSRHRPLERIRLPTNVAYEREINQQLRAAE